MSTSVANVSIKPKLIPNSSHKQCIECQTIPKDIIRITRTITKKSYRNIAYSSDTHHYCTECVPDNIPEGRNIAIAGEVITDNDLKRILKKHKNGNKFFIC
jgi:hypothetical protein